MYQETNNTLFFGAWNGFDEMCGDRSEASCCFRPSLIMFFDLGDFF